MASCVRVIIIVNYTGCGKKQCLLRIQLCSYIEEKYVWTTSTQVFSQRSQHWTSETRSNNVNYLNATFGVGSYRSSFHKKFNSPIYAKVSQMVFRLQGFWLKSCVFFLFPFHMHYVSHTHTPVPHSAVKISSLVLSVCNAFVCSSLGWKIYCWLLQSTSFAFLVVSQEEDRPPFVTGTECIPLKNALGWSAIVSCEGELILSCFIWLELCISFTLRLL